MSSTSIDGKLLKLSTLCKAQILTNNLCPKSVMKKYVIFGARVKLGNHQGEDRAGSYRTV